MTLDIKLGKYTLLEKLGRGGYGTVYRARDEVLEVERAVKVLHPALTADPEFIARFQREAKLTAQLEHPNIVPVYDLGEAEGSYFLIMKYMPGDSLKDLLEREGRLSFQRALQITEQIAAALDFVHNQSRQLIHRDVKPGNILFDNEGKAYLTDLGFAKALSGASSDSLSASGGMIGTSSYMAPEVWREKPVTPATDVYSLACTFFEMITGQALFKGESPAGIMTKHLMDGPQFPTQWPEDVPRSLPRILSWALAKKPAKRYASANKFLTELTKLKITGEKTGQIEEDDQRRKHKEEKTKPKFFLKNKTAIIAGGIGLALVFFTFISVTGLVALGRKESGPFDFLALNEPNQNLEYVQTSAAQTITASEKSTQDSTLSDTSIPGKTTEPLEVTTQSKSSETNTPSSTATSTPEFTLIPQQICSNTEDKVVNILISGVTGDSYLYGLADAIRVARIDFQTQEIIVLSFPRDLWVDIPISVPTKTKGNTPGKINQAYFYGTEGMEYYSGNWKGAGLLAETIQANFGLNIDHFLTINTYGFRNTIDTLGGLNICLEEPVYQKRNDFYSGVEFPISYLEAGCQKINGEQAEFVVRQRIMIGDEGRIKRQNKVLMALASQVLTLEGIKALPDIVTQLDGYFLTDLTSKEISELLCLAGKIDYEENIIYTNIPNDMITSTWMNDELRGVYTYALTVDKTEMRQLLADFQEGNWP